MKVTIARIYVTEGDHIAESIFKRLHDDHKVNGVTIFRGVSGFGRSGQIHSSSLLDTAFDLPMVVEFFDEPDKVKAALAALRDVISEGQTILIEAKMQ